MRLWVLLSLLLLQETLPHGEPRPRRPLPRRVPPLCEPPRAFLTAGPPPPPSARPPLPREAAAGACGRPSLPPAMAAPGQAGAISGAAVAGRPSCWAEAEGRRLALPVCGQRAAEPVRRRPKVWCRYVRGFRGEACAAAAAAVSR